MIIGLESNYTNWIMMVIKFVLYDFWNFKWSNLIILVSNNTNTTDSPRFENDRPWGEFLKKIRRCEIDSVSTQEFPCVDALPITECLNSSAVILCPTHAEVREINDEIFKIFKERNPSIETRRYRGRDITPEFGSVADDRPDCGSLPPLVLDLVYFHLRIYIYHYPLIGICYLRLW